MSGTSLPGLWLHSFCAAVVGSSATSTVPPLTRCNVALAATGTKLPPGCDAIVASRQLLLQGAGAGAARPPREQGVSERRRRESNRCRTALPCVGMRTPPAFLSRFSEDLNCSQALS